MSVLYFTSNMNRNFREYLPPRCQNRNRGIWKATHAIYPSGSWTRVGDAPHKFLYFRKSSERGSGRIILHIHVEHGDTLMLKLNFNFERSAAKMSCIWTLADSSDKVMESALRPSSTFSHIVCLFIYLTVFYPQCFRYSMVCISRKLDLSKP